MNNSTSSDTSEFIDCTFSDTSDITIYNLRQVPIFDLIADHYSRGGDFRSINWLAQVHPDLCKVSVALTWRQKALQIRRFQTQIQTILVQNFGHCYFCNRQVMGIQLPGGIQQYHGQPGTCLKPYQAIVGSGGSTAWKIPHDVVLVDSEDTESCVCGPCLPKLM